MNEHMNDEQIARVIAGLDLDDEATRHLGECVTCRRRVRELEETVAARRAEMTSEAPDWDLQWEQVMSSLPAQDRRPGRLWRPLAAAAAAAAAAVALLVLSPHQARQPQTRQIAVEKVLSEVNETLASDPLEGFAPLDQLVPDAQELADMTQQTTS